MPLALLGLRQLFISCGDPYGSGALRRVILAASTALEYEIFVCLALAKSARATITKRLVMEHFEEAGIPIPPIIDLPVIPFGRGSLNYSASDLDLVPYGDIAGPCPSMSRHPTIQADGTVTGCAVVFAKDCPPLGFGNINETAIPVIADRITESPLAVWIHKLVVVALTQLIEGNSGVRFGTHYANICHLCGDILNNKEALAVPGRLGFIGSTTGEKRL